MQNFRDDAKNLGVDYDELYKIPNFLRDLQEVYNNYKKPQPSETRWPDASYGLTLTQQIESYEKLNEAQANAEPKETRVKQQTEWLVKETCALRVRAYFNYASRVAESLDNDPVENVRPWLGKQIIANLAAYFNHPANEPQKIIHLPTARAFASRDEIMQILERAEAKLAAAERMPPAPIIAEPGANRALERLNIEFYKD